MSRKVRINMLPLQAHCFAFGGFEIQMLELFNALEMDSDIIVNKMNPWDRNEDFDVLHLWGLEQANFNNAYWAKQSGKKVVLTGLIGQVQTLKEHIRFKISSKIGNVRFLRKVLENVDAFVVVNELEAQKAINYFKMKKEKVFIIPNLITKAAIEAKNMKSQTISGLKNYFLCAGNISERKNQLMLAKAAIDLKLNVSFAGDFICSTKYKTEFLQLINKYSNLEYCGNFPNTSGKLFDLFKNADGFCLPSYQETQPISVLEAAFFGKNILIGNGAYSKQYLFRDLIKVNVKSLNSIKEGLLKLKSSTDSSVFNIKDEDLEKSLFHNVSNAYKKIYYN